ncbi:rubrerythrin-related protein [Pyrococcus sp. NA2]|uniref:ferritin family protein n=1 Tax=Pyrococcus sp. (strain NA2) TaxID=342949 RepID=UPI000209AA97|nr:ferritin family protein [Pyrococcus sp. NA2]AEC52585.1 rubrerythrin-related protein [Pyrococcus sp. NA2]
MDIESALSLENMKEFSIEELLGMAIKAEIGAVEFYKSLAEKIEVRALKERIRALAEEEKKHELLLREMYRSMFGEKEIKFPREHIGPELKPVERELRDIKDVIELIRWAMTAEKMASEFYKKLGEIVDSEEKKRLTRYLSNMEKGHYYMLRAEYELLLDWSMYSQMMHVGP